MLQKSKVETNVEVLEMKNPAENNTLWHKHLGLFLFVIWGAAALAYDISRAYLTIYRPRVRAAKREASQKTERVKLECELSVIDAKLELLHTFEDNVDILRENIDDAQIAEIRRNIGVDDKAALLSRKAAIQAQLEQNN
jgi:hypothetical protein